MIASIDNKTKKRSPEIIKILCRKWSLTKNEMIQSKKSVEAFGFSMKKNYPIIPSDWELISIYEASKILSEYLSRNTIDSYFKQGWLRGEDGKLYKQEIEYLKQGFDAIKFLFDKGVMGKEKIDGKKFIVAYPTQVAHLKTQPVDQDTRSWVKFVKHTEWVQDWMDFVDLSE